MHFCRCLLVCFNLVWAWNTTNGIAALNCVTFCEEFTAIILRKCTFSKYGFPLTARQSDIEYCHQSNTGQHYNVHLKTPIYIHIAVNVISTHLVACNLKVMKERLTKPFVNLVKLERFVYSYHLSSYLKKYHICLVLVHFCFSVVHHKTRPLVSLITRHVTACLLIL